MKLTQTRQRTVLSTEQNAYKRAKLANTCKSDILTIDVRKLLCYCKAAGEKSGCFMSNFICGDNNDDIDSNSLASEIAKAREVIKHKNEEEKSRFIHRLVSNSVKNHAKIATRSSTTLKINYIYE